MDYQYITPKHSCFTISSLINPTLNTFTNQNGVKYEKNQYVQRLLRFIFIISLQKTMMLEVVHHLDEFYLNFSHERASESYLKI